MKTIPHEGLGLQIDQSNLAPVADWLVSGNTGLSSMHLLATALAGRLPERTYLSHRHPLDADDLNRCLVLIAKAPWVREVAFPILHESCSYWKALIDHWDELEQLCPESGWSWQAVTDRMQELFAEID